MGKADKGVFMLENHQAFEWMIHVMELSVIVGIIAVTWYVKKTHKNSPQPTQENAPKE